MKTRTLLLSGLASAALIAGMANAQEAETETDADGTVTTMTVPIQEPEGTETAEEDVAPEGDDATLAQDEEAMSTDDEDMTAETEADPTATGDAPMTAEGEADPATMEDDSMEGDSMTAETDPAMTETTETETETATVTTEDSSGLYGAFAQIPVAEIVGMNVLDGSGESVGNVEQLVSFDGEPNAILGIGGFLGLGQHEVAVPLNRFEMTDDGLVLPDATREELEAMQEWDGETGTEMQTDLTVEEAA